MGMTLLDLVTDHKEIVSVFSCDYFDDLIIPASSAVETRRKCEGQSDTRYLFDIQADCAAL